VHGANRLGGNGVANSTVFGAIAGDAIAAWTTRHGAWREPGGGTLEEAEERARAPLGRPAGNLEELREALYQVMWDDVGIVRDAAGLSRASARLAELRARLEATGVASTDLRYNLTWHDWLNLDSLLAASGAILASAEARRESRGAHFREDFPQTGALGESAFSRVRLVDGRFDVAWKPVRFTRVRPGETILQQ